MKDGRRGGLQRAVPAFGCRGDLAKGCGRLWRAPLGLRRARDGPHKAWDSWDRADFEFFRSGISGLITGNQKN
ncbi:hypothetical protein CDL15_Pgr009233 [Punica granatum]|uniref:Uncharacterized protein n=1 Tax=Punica granatum TaxID=22663 RepID=A0A218WW10_PUNGR|nr:hypothetical protein CDL15_Pgr009233 [Punica granatum]